MKTYIWKYSASVHGGKGKIKGRVKAPTFSEAETAVKENNLMVDAVSNLKLDRSPNARLHSFEKWGKTYRDINLFGIEDCIKDFVNSWRPR